MRKQIINQNPQNVSPVDERWLDLQRLAQVELTSEEAAHPIEAALIPGIGSGWRAAQAGEQTIHLLFDELQSVRRIQLLFHEDQQARTQEFVLRWSPDAGQSYREIVRQQYNFSPPGMTREFEDYTVDLVGVTALELRIVPDISGGDARASVAQLRIA
ncbi:carbohydrate-binding protein [Methyloglobulus sp.]|uniref:carbohydrate-binding protein n=1 Tax=Methyloglobulus sp. TaxID=2518622 RepID=UPI003989BF7C